MIKKLNKEISRLGEMLHQERVKQGVEKPKPVIADKIDRTIAEMQRMGCSQEDIDTFKQGVAA